MKNEVIQKQIDLAEADIIKNEVLIGYLESLKGDWKMTKEEKAKTDMKIDALNRDIKFNKGYIEYATKLL